MAKIYVRSLSKVIFFGADTVISVGSDELTFGAAVELSVAMPLSWLPLISDYTKDAKKPLQATIVSVFIYGIVSTFMYVIGMGAAIYTGEYDIASIMIKSGLGVFGLLIIVFSTVTTTFLDAYSAGVSSVSILEKINAKWSAVLVTIVGTIAALIYPMDDITDFIYFIGSVFAPMIAIQIADFFVMKQKSKEKKAISWINTVLWLIGFLIYRMLMHIDIVVGNTLPDMFITIVLHNIVWRVYFKVKH